MGFLYKKNVLVIMQENRRPDIRMLKFYENKFRINKF